jgi:CheY-like chemotaxis protein
MLIADDDPSVLRALAARCTGMGFDVETAGNGLQTLIKTGLHRPDVLVIDVLMPEADGFSVLSYLSDAAKQSLHVIMITGRPSQKIVEKCEGLHASCIKKGPDFWNEFEARLAAIYPDRADAILQAAKQSPKSEMRQRPRLLLVDDDISVKEMFFHTFAKLDAKLLYAANGTQGFWTARREEPTAIVCDYCMQHGDAEYLLTRLRTVPETSNIPVIVQSGRRLNDTVKHRLRQEIGGKPGAARILRKSADTAELFDVLQRFCGFAVNPAGEPLHV